MHNLFLVETISIAPRISLNLLFEKEMNLRELIECYIQVEIPLGEDNSAFKRTKKLRYVYEDKIISFDRLMSFILKLLKEIVETIEAVDSGLNLSTIQLNLQKFSEIDIEIRKEIKRSIENINEYKLQPFIIKLYTILTSFKGTDTLQKRKYKRMIEHQEMAMQYQNRRDY